MERKFVRFLGSWLLEETIYSLSLYRLRTGFYQADLWILHPDGTLNGYTAPRFFDSDEDAVAREPEYLVGYVQSLGHDPMKAIRLQDDSYDPPTNLLEPMVPSTNVVEIEAWFLARKVLDKAATCP